MTFDLTEETMRQNLNQILEEVGEDGEFSVDERYIRIYGVKY